MTATVVEGSVRVAEPARSASAARRMAGSPAARRPAWTVPATPCAIPATATAASAPARRPDLLLAAPPVASRTCAGKMCGDSDGCGGICNIGDARPAERCISNGSGGRTCCTLQCGSGQTLDCSVSEFVWWVACKGAQVAKGTSATTASVAHLTAAERCAATATVAVESAPVDVAPARPVPAMDREARTCCTPSCTDGTCSVGDGCGGTCDTCTSGQVCHSQTCCTPSCTDGTCNVGDGCGGTCNTCKDSQICPEPELLHADLRHGGFVRREERWLRRYLQQVHERSDL